MRRRRVDCREGRGHWLDRLAWRAATLLVLGLFAVQWAMARPQVRELLNRTDHLESLDASQLLQQVMARDPGRPSNASPALAPPDEPVLTLVLKNAEAAPDVRLIVGGEAAGTFAKDVVLAPVRAGQRIEIDATRDARELVFEILPSKWLRSPLPRRVTLHGTTMELGDVAVDLSP